MEKEYLILLLDIMVIVILALVTTLVFYRRKLAMCMLFSLSDHNVLFPYRKDSEHINAFCRL